MNFQRQKGDPRPATARRRAQAKLDYRLREMAARIPSRAVFEDFVSAAPEHLQGRIREELQPWTTFNE